MPLLDNLLDTRGFLYSLCTRALEIDNSIKFVGVVNNDSKLIIGKANNNLINNMMGWIFIFSNTV